MDSNKIENGVVDLGRFTLAVPNSVSPEAQTFLSSNPWGEVPETDEPIAMWETREATDAAFRMLNDFALMLWPCDVEETSIDGVRCHRICKKDAPAALTNR